MLSKIGFVIAVLLGLTNIGNGVFMVVAPESWYWLVPGVPDRGPFNQHFIRDIGFIYLLIGAAYTYGALYPQHRLLLWLMPTTWLTAHAGFHVWEVIVGICGPEALIVDFAGVTLPAILGLGLVYGGYRTRAGA